MNEKMSDAPLDTSLPETAPEFCNATWSFGGCIMPRGHEGPHSDPNGHVWWGGESDYGSAEFAPTYDGLKKENQRLHEIIASLPETAPSDLEICRAAFDKLMDDYQEQKRTIERLSTRPDCPTNHRKTVNYQVWKGAPDNGYMGYEPRRVRHTTPFCPDCGEKL